MSEETLKCKTCGGEVHVVRSNDKLYDVFEKTKGKVLHAFDCPCKREVSDAV